MENQPKKETTGKLIHSAITMLLTIVTIVVTMSFYFAGMKQDIALVKQDVTNIKENHLQHIYKELEKQEGWNEKADERFDKIDLKLERILTILGD